MSAASVPTTPSKALTKPGIWEQASLTVTTTVSSFASSPEAQAYLASTGAGLAELKMFRKTRLTGRSTLLAKICRPTQHATTATDAARWPFVAPPMSPSNGGAQTPIDQALVPSATRCERRISN